MKDPLNQSWVRFCSIYRLVIISGCRHVERFVKADDHAGLMEQRDELNTQLLATQDEVQRRKDEIAELKAEVREFRPDRHHVTQLYSFSEVAVDLLGHIG